MNALSSQPRFDISNWEKPKIRADPLGLPSSTRTRFTVDQPAPGTLRSKPTCTSVCAFELRKLGIDGGKFQVKVNDLPSLQSFTTQPSLPRWPAGSSGANDASNGPSLVSETVISGARKRSSPALVVKLEKTTAGGAGTTFVSTNGAGAATSSVANVFVITNGVWTYSPTLSVVQIPATGSDAAAGIAATNTYLAALDFGDDTTALAINGVNFTQVSVAGNGTGTAAEPVFTGVDANYGGSWTLTASNTAGNAGAV